MLDFIFNNAGILNFLVNQSEKIEAYLSTWNLVDGGRNEWAWKTITDDSAIVGILMTLFARVVLELALWVGGNIWKGFRAESAVDDAEEAAGIKDAGYYES